MINYHHLTRAQLELQAPLDHEGKTENGVHLEDLETQVLEAK